MFEKVHHSAGKTCSANLKVHGFYTFYKIATSTQIVISHSNKYDYSTINSLKLFDNLRRNLIFTNPLNLTVETINIPVSKLLTVKAKSLIQHVIFPTNTPCAFSPKTSQAAPSEHRNSILSEAEGRRHVWFFTGWGAEGIKSVLESTKGDQARVYVCVECGGGGAGGGITLDKAMMDRMSCYWPDPRLSRWFGEIFKNRK